MSERILGGANALLTVQPALKRCTQCYVAYCHSQDVPDDDALRARFRTASLPGYQSNHNVWIPLTLAMNCIYRSMGQPDLYPFVLSPFRVTIVVLLRFDIGPHIFRRHQPDVMSLVHK
jgi:hypothetical protein